MTIRATSSVQKQHCSAKAERRQALAKDSSLFESEYLKKCNAITKNVTRIRVRTEEDIEAGENRRRIMARKVEREDATVKANILRKQRIQEKITRLSRGDAYLALLSTQPREPERPVRTLARKRIPGSVHAVIAEDLYAVGN
jgi:hypothetical protein